MDRGGVGRNSKPIITLVRVDEGNRITNHLIFKTSSILRDLFGPLIIFVVPGLQLKTENQKKCSFTQI